jgi:hypothetical protein
MAQTKGARAPEFAFEKEENVLAYHGPLIYQAQVLDRCAKDALEGTLKLKLYLLHYTGWNSHWDEWVAESRVLKDTQANVALQKERVKEFQRAHKRRLAKSADGADGGKRQKPTDDVPLQVRAIGRDRRKARAKKAPRAGTEKKAARDTHARSGAKNESREREARARGPRTRSPPQRANAPLPLHVPPALCVRASPVPPARDITSAH